jgi:hypothetical protein
MPIAQPGRACAERPRTRIPPSRSAGTSSAAREIYHHINPDTGRARSPARPSHDAEHSSRSRDGIKVGRRVLYDEAEGDRWWETKVAGELNGSR